MDIMKAQYYNNTGNFVRQQKTYFFLNPYWYYIFKTDVQGWAERVLSLVVSDKCTHN